MAKYLLLLLTIGIGASCKHKKVSLADDQPVDIADFIDYFRPLSLPCQFADSVLGRTKTDTAAIGYRTLLRFVPDSVLSRQFGKTGRPKLYPVGKAGGGKNETYIFIKALGTQKRVLYVLCFTGDRKFAASKALITKESGTMSSSLVTMDARFTLTILRQHAGEGQAFYRKEAYVFNNAGAFMLILTESNEATPETAQVYNPIDTLPRKHKFSGDYVQDRRNFISFRDGRDNYRYLFFVHFEKDDGKCRGELKGEARLVTATTARHKSNSDPCLIDFYFTGNSVRMKELEGCGNHRDIKCYFEGSFEKRKEIRPKPGKRRVACIPQAQHIMLC